MSEDVEKEKWEFNWIPKLTVLHVLSGLKDEDNEMKDKMEGQIKLMATGLRDYNVKKIKQLDFSDYLKMSNEFRKKFNLPTADDFLE